MINNELRDMLAEGCEATILFDNPSYDYSIIGLSTNGNAIYSLELMAKEFAKDSNSTIEDAYDFIAYNTIRMLPYIDGLTPIILDDDFVWDLWKSKNIS